MRRVFLLSMLALMGVSMFAQELNTYRRNALTTMLVYHPEDEFGGEIYKAFDSLPIPDKYDDHSVGIRVIDNSTISGVQRNESGYYKAYLRPCPDQGRTAPQCAIYRGPAQSEPDG